MFDLSNRVAVVTGGGTGIGKQFATALASQGAQVAILSRRQEVLDEAAKEIEKKTGAEIFPISTDVTDPESIKESHQAILDKFGKVDILVNNAGGGNNAPLTEITDEAWHKTFNLDVDGMMYMTREFGAKMVDNGYGRIINVASILGFGGLPELPIIDYAAAKGAVVNFTRAAATEWATTGVTVNAIAPGFFASEANDAEAMEAMSDFIEVRTPMKRPGKPGELASAVVFLAADESTYVTGQIVGVDGGWTAI